MKCGCIGRILGKYGWELLSTCHFPLPAVWLGRHPLLGKQGSENFLPCPFWGRRVPGSSSEPGWWAFDTNYSPPFPGWGTHSLLLAFVPFLLVLSSAMYCVVGLDLNPVYSFYPKYLMFWVLCAFTQKSPVNSALARYPLVWTFPQQRSQSRWHKVPD